MRSIIYRAVNVSKKEALQNFINKCSQKVDENLLTILFTFNENEAQPGEYCALENSLENLYLNVSQHEEYKKLTDDIGDFYDTDHSQDEIYDFLIDIVQALIKNACLVLRDKIPEQMIIRWETTQNVILERHLEDVEEQLGLEREEQREEENEPDDNMDQNQEDLPEPPDTVEQQRENVTGSGQSRRILF
tara:strand:+ start:2370 stop:2939 length:570 start_codon:yes stop_codon:yes gene_type:complete